MLFIVPPEITCCLESPREIIKVPLFVILPPARLSVLVASPPSKVFQSRVPFTMISAEILKSENPPYKDMYLPAGMITSPEPLIVGVPPPAGSVDNISLAMVRVAEPENEPSVTKTRPMEMDAILKLTTPPVISVLGTVYPQRILWVPWLNSSVPDPEKPDEAV